METITSFRNEYEFLSNFYPCVLTYEGRTYPTSEHAYQAAKFRDPIIVERIASAPTPGKAKTWARDLDGRREDWNEVKYSLMERILRVKFSSPDLKEKLLSTGDKYLVEGNSWGDVYWGVCRGEGLNMLGKLLMQIRGELRSN